MSRHVVLIVEDDEGIAKILRQVVESLGYEAVHASTREAALAVIARRSFCCVLLDMQIPDTEGTIALVTTGLTLLKQDLRGAFPGRTASDKHCMQVVVVTGYAKTTDFVTRVMQEGADDFITKPFDADLTVVADKISRCLRHSERVDHEACGAATERAALRSVAPGPALLAQPSPANGRTARIFITARVARKRFDLLFEDKSITSAEASVKALLTFAAARGGGSPGWVHVSEMGKEEAVHKALSRLRGEFRQLLAERGIADLLTNDSGRYCLDERVLVEVDERLERSDNAVIRRLATSIRSGVAPVAPKKPGAFRAKNKGV